jgi:hypothetical protein
VLLLLLILLLLMLVLMVVGLVLILVRVCWLQHRLLLLGRHTQAASAGAWQQHGLHAAQQPCPCQLLLLLLWIWVQAAVLSARRQA